MENLILALLVTLTLFGVVHLATQLIEIYKDIGKGPIIVFIGVWTLCYIVITYVSTII